MNNVKRILVSDNTSQPVPYDRKHQGQHVILISGPNPERAYQRYVNRLLTNTKKLS